MIHFSDVSKYYENEIALKDINFTVEKGELLFVTGPSGAGKTTLLKLIYRSERLDEGHIHVAGWDVEELKQKSIPYLRSNIGIVFQDFRLLLNRTVFDNIALPLRIHGFHPKEIKEDVLEVLKDVALKHKANDLPQHLSGGEQQRVVIARAMVSKPTVLLADEPTGNLDPDTSAIIMKLLKEINVRGTTVLIATHNSNLFTNTGRRVIHLRDGELVKESRG
ncbi:MAG: cell division ATP-binding protein FtsE [Thermodesulfovibrionia bacterium]|nr:cell division ATP-binding protein FtsE [Thermodesulfovibrionia bacterium]MCK5287022.1 cell division ATP-binding protein FtsE [Thermodesulfovibrionia bacterium]MCK5511403.1 cell division ATP-binding protein FtsE [Thermodesulfovibrionia bacterium]